MKPWQTKATVAFFAFCTGFIACFWVFSAQPPDRLSHDLGYSEGFDDGQRYGAKNGYDEGLLPVLPVIIALVGCVAVVGLIVAVIRFKQAKEPSWTSCRPACIAQGSNHDPRCPLAFTTEAGRDD